MCKIIYHLGEKVGIFLSKSPARTETLVLVCAPTKVTVGVRNFDCIINIINKLIFRCVCFAFTFINILDFASHHFF